MNKIALALVSLASVAAHAVTPCNTSATACMGQIKIGAARSLRYSTSFDLDVTNPDVTHAVVMIHAADRYLPWGFDRMNALIARGDLSPNTLVVLPLFLADIDKPATGLLYWGANDWSGGFDSLDGSRTSSFAALDVLMKNILGGGHFPNLKSVTITGLSAGGQFTQRYALGTTIDHDFAGVRFNFVIAAPSSYTYLNADRWDGTRFARPVATSCAYNTYRYGLDQPNAYMSRFSAQVLARNFTGRDLAFISGADDDATEKPNPPIPQDPKNGADLDVSCAAKLQGASRLERSYRFHEYLSAEYPATHQVWYSIPGVAHSYAVYDDPRVVELLR